MNATTDVIASPGVWGYATGGTILGIVSMLLMIVVAGLTIWQRHRFSTRWCGLCGNSSKRNRRDEELGQKEGDQEVHQAIKQIASLTVNIGKELGELHAEVKKATTPQGSTGSEVSRHSTNL
jgi:hypothetical protein